MRHRNPRTLGRPTANDDGYTLTEMLVVIAIIGLIAAMLTPNLLSQMGRARVKTAQLQIDTVVSSVEMFRSDVGRYPTSSEGLGALRTEPSGIEGWIGPYLKDRKALDDPWGNPLRYELAPMGGPFRITSYGADGKAGGSGLDHDLVAPSE